MIGEEQTRFNHNVRWNNINAIFSTLSQNMLAPFTGIFAIKLGASDSLIAALSSWPALVSLLTMIPGARHVDRHPRQKRLVSWLMFLNRIFFLALALLPWLLPKPDLQPLAFVALIAIMNMPGSLALIAWQSFMGKIIPASERGKVFAKRNQLMSFIGIGASLGAGWIMDRLMFPFGFQIMFFVGFLLALAEIWAFSRSEEPPAAEVIAPRRPSKFAFSLATLKEQLHNNKSYWLFAGASLLFHIGWQMGWPLYTKYQVQVLGATTTWVSIFGICSSLASVAAYPIWARLAERHGNQRLLSVATLGMALTPLLYTACSELWMLALLHFIIGTSTAGTTLLLLNTLLELSPETSRTQYIAYHNTATNATATVAPYVGVFLAAALSTQWAMILTALGRALGAGALAYVYRLSTKGETSTVAR